MVKNGKFVFPHTALCCRGSGGVAKDKRRGCPPPAGNIPDPFWSTDAVCGDGQVRHSHTRRRSTSSNILKYNDLDDFFYRAGLEPRI